MVLVHDAAMVHDDYIINIFRGNDNEKDEDMRSLKDHCRISQCRPPSTGAVTITNQASFFFFLFLSGS